MRMRQLKKTAVAAAVALVAAAGLGTSAGTQGAGAPAAVAGRPAASVSRATLLRDLEGRGTRVAPANRLASPDRVLPRGWSRSKDEVLAMHGDESGLHVLVASESSGYAWRTVATLGDPGVETSQWIGTGCLAASGRFAVVVYAPREVTNLAGQMGVLGRAAIVNLATGSVRQLGGGFSVAYFDPGCGAGDTVVLTHGGWGDDSPKAPAMTGLQVVNAVTGQTMAEVTEPGQVTSAVPYRGGIAAAYQRGLVQISTGGKVTLLARSATVPFRLVPDADGGVAYETLADKVVQVHRFAGSRSVLVGRAALGTVMLQGSAGRVWLTGPRAARLGRLPGGWRAVDVPAGSLISTTGTLAVTGIGSARRSGIGKRDAAAALPVDLKAQVLAGRRPVASFTVATTAARVQPIPRSAQATRGAGGGAGLDYSAQKLRQTGTGDAVTAATAGSPSTPVSADRTCAIAIDDPSIQAYQPDYNQVEWAVDQAVQGDLTDSRPAGLYGSSLPSYTPQGLFSSPSLDGGGTMPAQVLLGVLTQESNLEQASAHDIQGQASNPLTSFNWYGNWVDEDDTWVDSTTINWATSDCGYGIGQVTTGMCLTQGQAGDPECEYATPMPAEDQLAVAVDYQANIAASMRILSDAWNQLYSDGITFSTQASSTAPEPEADYINSWYMALWAYNSGLEPGSFALGNPTGCTPGPTCTDAAGDWGLGYADNPINPIYPPDRPVFPGTSSATAPDGGTYNPTWDMSNPEYWPYQEKVLSWAYNSITLYNYNTGADQQAFAYAIGNATYPPLATFCTSADNCSDSGLDTSGDNSSGFDSCTLTGSFADHCWWHEPVSWTYCNVLGDSCGTSVLTYAAGAAAPADPTIAAFFAQKCTESPLPSTAVIVGDGGQAALGCPGQNWTAAGPMTWNFAADTSTSPTTYPSKIQFDQIGAGIGGHFWFGYTIPNNNIVNGGTSTNVTSTTPSANYTDQKVTGTWAAPSSVTSWTWAQVYVAIPGIGAWDPQANYQISPGGGQASQYRIVNQAQQRNSWISLGIFHFDSGGSVSLSNVTYSGLGDDIAWSAVAFVPSVAPTADYVAMGDSYSSGEGNQPFDPDSDYSNNGITDACHRSGPTGAGDAFSNQFDLDGASQTVVQQAATPGSGVQYQFLACSGDVSTSMDPAVLDSANASPVAYGSSYGKVVQGYLANTPWINLNPSLGYGEIPQVDTGWLNPDTTLVTLTAGGDDVRFADVLKGCIGDQLHTPSENCASGSYTMPGDPEPLTEYEPAVINALGPHLYQLYSDVAKAAPNAEIIVMGYPRLFAGDASAADCPINAAAAVLTLVEQTFDLPAYGFTIPAAVTQWMNSMGDLLNSVISNEVKALASTGVDIQFINPNSPGGSIAGFEGHNICDASGNNPPADGQWTNGLINYDISGSSADDQGPDGLPVTVPGSGSFHINAAGQQDFADLVSECLEMDICPVGSYKS
jgi:hypothetical protein